MVDNIIVATFSNVNAAHDAARAIKDLKEAGGTKFKLKSGVIVTKDDQGSVSVLESDVHPFHGTKVGVAKLSMSRKFVRLGVLLGTLLTVSIALNAMIILADGSRP